MMRGYKTTIEGHTVEIRYSGTGSRSSWESEYCNENNIRLIGTSDIAYFALVDGDTIYKLKHNSHKFMEADYTNWEEAKTWLENNNYDKYSLKEALENLSKLKGKW